MDIKRFGDTIEIFWGDDLLVSGLDATPIGAIDIGFWYHSSLQGRGSFFGSESLNLVSVTTHAPEPATMLLFGSGLIGLAGFRKKLLKRALR